MNIIWPKLYYKLFNVILSQFTAVTEKVYDTRIQELFIYENFRILSWTTRLYRTDRTCISRKI